MTSCAVKSGGRFQWSPEVWLSCLRRSLRQITWVTFPNHGDVFQGTSPWNIKQSVGLVHGDVGVVHKSFIIVAVLMYHQLRLINLWTPYQSLIININQLESHNCYVHKAPEIMKRWNTAQEAEAAVPAPVPRAQPLDSKGLYDDIHRHG